MKTTNIGSLLGLLALLAMIPIFSGCESNTPLVIEGNTNAVQIVLNFDEPMADKSDGDFELCFTIEPEMQPEGEHIQIIRKLEVEHWVVQGMLEIPADEMMVLNAEATIWDELYFSDPTHIGPLHEGEVTTLELWMHH